MNKKFRCTNGGPRSRVCARATLRTAPHRHQPKFVGAHVCKKPKIQPPIFFFTSNLIPIFELNPMQNLRTLGQPLLGEK